MRCGQIRGNTKKHKSCDHVAWQKEVTQMSCPNARAHWADVSRRELTVSAGRLAKNQCPLSQFDLRTSVSRLMYVKKNGLVDTGLQSTPW